MLDQAPSLPQLMSNISDALDRQPRGTYCCFPNCPRVPENLIRSLTALTFDPEKLANVLVPVPEGVKLLKKLHHQNAQVYLLSNFNSEAFAAVRRRHVDLFNLFDGVIVSGEVGLLKPNPRLFELILKRWNIADASQCIYLDDAPENVQGANQFGLNAILFDPQHIQSIEHKIQLHWNEENK